MTDATAPRLAPLTAEERSDEQRELIESYKLGDGRENNIFTVMARHASLMRRWMRFNGSMLVKGVLPARDRELLVLRTVWLCGAEYEWGHHRRFAEQAGLTEADLKRVVNGPDDEQWDGFESTLLRAADDLHHESCVSDATWAGLAHRYDEQQLIEVVMLVGSYHIAAYSVNSLRIPLEDGFTGFPSAAQGRAHGRG